MNTSKNLAYPSDVSGFPTTNIINQEFQQKGPTKKRMD